MNSEEENIIFTKRKINFQCRNNDFLISFFRKYLNLVKIMFPLSFLKIIPE